MSKKKTDLTQVCSIGHRFVEHVEDKEVMGTFNFIEIYGDGYHGNLDSILSYGYVKIMGYIYHFPNLLKRYVVGSSYGIGEYYAPNKTMLRKVLSVGTIEYIMEIE